MPTHSFTEEDLQRIDRAIAQGVRTVTFSDGRKVEYSTFEELVARRNFIAGALEQSAGRLRTYAEFTKGVKP